MNESSTRAELELALSRLTDRTLSRPEVYAHVALLLFASGMAVVMGMLLFGEALPEGMPPRTVIAFAVMLAIALAWVVFGVSVLARRRPLLANRELVAARMALVFSSLFTIGAALTGAAAASRLDTGAARMGATMVVVALALVVRAHLRRASLKKLRESLERELANSAG
jgi:hypothetical protein